MLSILLSKTKNIDVFYLKTQQSVSNLFLTELMFSCSAVILDGLLTLCLRRNSSFEKTCLHRLCSLESRNSLIECVFVMLTVTCRNIRLNRHM